LYFWGLPVRNSRLLLSAAVAIGTMLGVGAASAADLGMKAMPYAAPVRVFNWTGCYVGVHGGGGVMRNSVDGGLMEVAGSNYTGSGGLAGGQVGCNYQQGNWVFGAEGEGYWSGLKATSASSNSEGTTGALIDRSTDTTKNKWDFSIAARAGVAFDRTFIYGKAGWVWGKFDILSTDFCCSTPGGSLSTNSASGTLDGLLLGVGVEHAITDNWTLKLEYNFLKYGSKELTFTNCNNVGTPGSTCFNDSTSTVRADKQIFKIGANYLFSMH
jgi:outer membrane immunogenic protein